MELDLTPIDTASLKAKYNLSSAQLQKWLRQCKIESFQKGRHFYVYAYQVEVVDRLAAHMSAKGAELKDFNPFVDGEYELVNELKDEALLFPVNELANALTPEKIEEWASIYLGSYKVKSLMDRLNALEEIASKHYYCSNKELAELIGVSRIPFSGYYARGYFFWKKGKSRWWFVTKEKEFSNYLPYK